MTDEQERREEEKWDSWNDYLALEPDWWRWQEHNLWKQEQEDGLRHTSTK